MEGDKNKPVFYLDGSARKGSMSSQEDSTGSTPTPSYIADPSGALAFDFQKCNTEGGPLCSPPAVSNNKYLVPERLPNCFSDTRLTESHTNSPAENSLHVSFSYNALSSSSPTGQQGDKSKHAGKLRRLLRRSHSAGCGKDVPSHALFLREHKEKQVCTFGSFALYFRYFL